MTSTLIRKSFITGWLLLLVLPLRVTAASLGTWSSIDVGRPAEAFVSGIAYGNGTWVVVGQNGFIATSPDGRTWTRRNAGITRDFNDVTFSSGRFIAVCKAPDNDTGTGAKIWTSDNNGAAWTSRNTDSGLNYLSVGLHAVASDGSGNLIAVGGMGWVTRSFDNGTTWNVLMPPAKFTAASLYGVGYGNGKWIATGNGNGLYRSTDGGATWSEISTTNGSTRVAFGNNRFVLADNAKNQLRWSADGITWKSATKFGTTSTSFSLVHGCVFFDGLFVAVTEYGDIWTSENGREFKQWRAAGTDPDAWCVGAGNGMYIAGGGDFTLHYGTAWMSPAWLRARTGSTWDFPFTAFDTEEGLPRRIGLPEYRVNTASLNLVLEATLFYMQTLGAPVNLRLVYNSAPTADGADTIGLFGKNWRFRYESVIGQFGPEAQVITGGGRNHLYVTPHGEDLTTATTGNPITLLPPDGVFDELKFYGQYFELREKDSKMTYRYGVAGGPGNALWRLTQITDRSGNQLNLAVDAATGRINSITDPASRQVMFTYDTGNNLCTGITLPDGRTVTFSYDTHKNLTGINDMAGYTGNYTYDDKGFLTKMTTAGRQTTFTYAERAGMETNNGDKVVATVTNPKGQLTRYELLPDNAGVKRIDAKGGITTFKSAAGQTAKVTDPLGNLRQVEYNSAKLPAVFTDGNGKTTTFTYDSHGNPLTAQDALGNQTTQTFDSRDNLLTRVDALGKTWTYTYDANDRLTSVKSPLQNTTEFTYLGNGRLERLRDARSNATTYQYDTFGNLTRLTDPLNRITQLAYDNAGLRCSSLTDARGKVKSLTYDGNDRLASVTYNSVAGNPQRVNAFDAFGQTKLTDELGQEINVVRNEFGYVTSLTDPLGHATTTEYDANNNPISVTDALDRVTTTSYDSANRPLILTDARGKTVKREYDANGNLISLTDKKNNKTTFRYDANDRLLETKDPLAKSVVVTRDAMGRIATTTNARGQVIRYTYDDDGRLVKKEYKESTGGSFAQEAAFTYDANGNRLTGVDDWGTTTYTYDLANQPTTLVYPTGKTATFTYNENGKVASITYPDGLVVNYTYDDYNRLNIPARFRSPTGTELQGNYERPNHITRLTMTLGGATRNIDFTYDKAGNRVSETRSNNTSTTYTYDNAQRVTAVLHQSGTNALLQSQFTYDAVGNVTGETPTGSAQVNPDLPTAGTTAYNAANQVTTHAGKAYTYDLDGNLTTIAGNEFSATYTPENRPNQITRPTGVVQYTYDADGLRVKRAVTGGVTNQFHYAPDDRLLFTTDGAGNLTARYIWSGPMLAAVLTGNSLDTNLGYAHLGRLGNVLALTDAGGEVTAKYAYQPYGAVHREGGSDSDLFTFAGGLGIQDEGGGLFYMKNRFYDATTGRFLQRDPLGFEGGVNLYAYANNNPLSYLDPTGMASASEWFWWGVNKAVKTTVTVGTGAATFVAVGAGLPGLAAGAVAAGVAYEVYSGAERAYDAYQARQKGKQTTESMNQMLNTKAEIGNAGDENKQLDKYFENEDKLKKQEEETRKRAKGSIDDVLEAIH